MSSPNILLLPKPCPSSSHSVGQLLTSFEPSESLATTQLSDRDYDDTHTTSYYKDIVTIDEESDTFTASLGGSLLVEPPPKGLKLGCIEAERVVVRTFKNAQEAFKKVIATQESKAWLNEQVGQGKGVLFVSGVREAKNTNYRRASMSEAAGGLVEVEKVISHESEAEDMEDVPPAPIRRGSRRDSGLNIDTKSNKDILGLELRKVLVKDGSIELGDLLTQDELSEFWKSTMYHVAK